MDNSRADTLYQAASVWNELTEYHYLLTYGRKNKLYKINLTFSPEDFPHLAGFQYLKDIVFPRYNPKKIISRILDGTIRSEQIQKAALYEKMILPRLEALIRIKDTFDGNCRLFSYMPRMYPFYTQIKADFLITYHSDMTSFVFIIQADTNHTAVYDYLCCSAFQQTERDYECNQHSLTLLKKERIHIPTGKSTILINKLHS